MSDLFEGMHAKFFEELFSLDEASRQYKAQCLREAGFPEAAIARLCAAGIRAGTCFGGCHLGDVGRFVERILFFQGAGSVLLRITRLPLDEDGHLEVAVLEIGPPVEEPSEAAELPDPDEPPAPDELPAREC